MNDDLRICRWEMSSVLDGLYVISRILNRRPCSVKNSTIDKNAKIGNGAQIVNSSVGKYTYIYESKVICADIGKFCSIAADCTIGGGTHPLKWVSTSPVFSDSNNVFHKHFSDKTYEPYTKTTIGNDVWIGSKCLIKGGIRIGDGAVIGMGSVVTHDVPPFEIWAGNPARYIRKRFSEEIIEGLCSIKWWDWDDEKLEKYAVLFDDPEELLKEYFS